VAIQRRPRSWLGPVVSVGEAAEDTDELVHLGLLLPVVPAADGLRHAVLHMVTKDVLLDALQRRPRRPDLGQDVHAITLALHHPDQPPNLPLDAPEPLELAGVPGVSVLHERDTIPW
jgi:hypothetical protein